MAGGPRDRRVLGDVIVDHDHHRLFQDRNLERLDDLRAVAGKRRGRRETYRCQRRDQQ